MASGGYVVRLSVVVPVYNEASTIAEVLRRIESVDLEKEIIVVDDGSEDGTRDYLKSLAPQNAKVIFHDRNRGKGAAIRTGLGHVTGDVVIVQDADLEYDPRDYFELLRPFVEAGATVVYGSRNLLPTNGRSSWSFYWGGRFLSLLANLLYGCSITDEATCYKAFDAQVLRSMELRCEGFEFCPEVTAKACLAGHRIIEVPIRYYPRSFDAGKKIRWRDGLVAIYTLVKYRLSG